MEHETVQVQAARRGGPELLKVVDVPQQQPGAGQVLISTHFAGINFADIMARMGLYPGAPRLPLVPGLEVAGTVESVGAGVDGFAPGDRVCALTRFGGYSSRVVVDQVQVRPVPPGVDLEAAAALPVTYLTAYLMLFNQANLQSGQTVLIHSAGGGVGTAAVQLAAHAGARIIGTASAAKHERLRAMGVELSIDYRSEDFVAAVKAATAGLGADVVLDAQGPAHALRSLKALAPLGTLVLYGVQQHMGRTRLRPGLLRLFWELRTVRLAPLRLMNSSKGVYGFHLGRLATRSGAVHKAFDELLVWLVAGHISPVVDRIFPYAAAGEAHAYIQDRRNFGKVLLDFRAAL
ncbi:MAG: zinc-binding dehydrogenase [Candidatus Marinimicrobia bacterium]|nr:zinc-binding dehydrogenase [Candidatus Neomarinimicrobiota bacterium]